MIISLKGCHKKENFTVHPVFVIVTLVLQKFIKNYIQNICIGM